MAELVADALLQRDADFIRLTPRGRLLSNEIFRRFLAPVRNT
jgi:coproporphyrinogen III oxidase-like Fe-S oxidoreductase